MKNLVNLFMIITNALVIEVALEDIIMVDILMEEEVVVRAL